MEIAENQIKSHVDKSVIFGLMILVKNRYLSSKRGKKSTFRNVDN